MTIKHAFRITEKQMYQFQKLKKQVAEYMEEAESLKGLDLTADRVKSSGKSDPTAVGGLRIAEPPREIALKMAWIWAIESAWKKLAHTSPEKAELFEVYYGLNNIEGRPRELAGQVRVAFTEKHNISYRAFFLWKKDVVEAVVIAACQKGALRIYQ